MADEHRRHEDHQRRGSQRQSTDRTSRDAGSWARDDEARAQRGNDERTEPYRYGGEPEHWRDQGDGDYEANWRGGDRGFGDDRGAGRPYDQDRDQHGSQVGPGRGGAHRRHGGGYGRVAPEDERWGVGGSGRSQFGARRDYADQEYGRPYSNSSVWRERAPRGEEFTRADERGQSQLSDRDSGSGWDRGRYDAGRTSFAGRGPKDYRRSDERIREDISDRLMDDPDVDASDISVQVESGEVTLTGTVASRDQKRRAEDCIEHISGVREVSNNLKVKRQSAGEIS